MLKKILKYFILRPEEPKTRYYGDGCTIQHSTDLDIETYNGKVVGVWFRCQHLPFTQTKVDEHRAIELEHAYAVSKPIEIHALELKDI